MMIGSSRYVSIIWINVLASTAFTRLMTNAFLMVPSFSKPSTTFTKTLLSSTPSSLPSPSSVELITIPDRKPSEDWELDCYSRPVLIPGGKKLWEVLITDRTGSFRFVKVLPSNQVNSKEVRKTVEGLMEQIDVKPTTIRFFRGAMFNMLNIALSELDVVGRPSRCTFSLANWLEERHRAVYPKMEG